MIWLPTIGQPVIKTAAGTEYTLSTATIDIEPVSDIEVVRSVLTKVASVIDRGDILRGEINYWDAASLAEYAAIRALKGATVRIWPFGYGSIPNTSPIKYYPYVNVIFVNVVPYYKNNKYYYDALIITFESLEEYTLTWATDDGLGTGT